MSEKFEGVHESTDNSEKGETMVRVKLEPNGNYDFVSESEYEDLKKQEEKGSKHIYEAYVFKDCYEDEDGNLTGINYTGERMIIDEAPKEENHK